MNSSFVFPRPFLEDANTIETNKAYTIATQKTEEAEA